MSRIIFSCNPILAEQIVDLTKGIWLNHSKMSSSFKTWNLQCQRSEEAAAGAVQTVRKMTQHSPSRLTLLVRWMKFTCSLQQDIIKSVSSTLWKTILHLFMLSSRLIWGSSGQFNTHYSRFERHTSQHLMLKHMIYDLRAGLWHLSTFSPHAETERALLYYVNEHSKCWRKLSVYAFAIQILRPGNLR